MNAILISTGALAIFNAALLPKSRFHTLMYVLLVIAAGSSWNDWIFLSFLLLFGDLVAYLSKYK
jgi:hypothetical protein